MPSKGGGGLFNRPPAARLDARKTIPISHEVNHLRSFGSVFTQEEYVNIALTPVP
jgi:hypothetical protein